jgi:hypothetical protein
MIEKKNAMHAEPDPKHRAREAGREDAQLRHRTFALVGFSRQSPIGSESAPA